MRPNEDAAVRDLYHLCHPDFATPGPYWHFAHPTLVLTVKGRIVGSTSFMLSPDAKRGYVCYGADVCVHPAHRKVGYGRQLHEARCAIARDLGAIDFVGTVEPGNTAMVTILSRAGHKMSSALDRDFYIERL